MNNLKIESWTFYFINLYILYLYLKASYGKEYFANMTFPFTKITVQSNNNFNFTCDEEFTTMKQCAEQCYNREKTTEGCV